MTNTNQKGLFFESIYVEGEGKHVRALYRQFDGSDILADRCRCRVDWRPAFVVIKSPHCPIDEHRAAALQLEEALRAKPIARDPGSTVKPGRTA